MAGGKKILVVDDELDFRDLLSYLLRQKGYEVSVAANGAEGLNLYQSENPDLVLLDANLPDVTGFEICRRIRSSGPRPETPIVLCTVRSEVDGVSEGLSSGATDYVLKPIEVSDLLKRIESALEAKKN